MYLELGFAASGGQSAAFAALVAEAVGWRWAFAPLAVGPLVGTLGWSDCGRYRKPRNWLAVAGRAVTSR